MGPSVKHAWDHAPYLKFWLRSYDRCDQFCWYSIHPLLIRFLFPARKSVDSSTEDLIPMYKMIFRYYPNVPDYSGVCNL